MRTRLQADIATLLGEARSELFALRDEVGKLGADIQVAAQVAEERVVQTAKLARETVETRAASAGAGAVRDITATATQVAKLLEHQRNSAEAQERLEEVVDRLAAADARLRSSDERTKAALRHLRPVRDEE